MNWVKVVKSCPMWAHCWDNDYFFEAGENSLDGLDTWGSQFARWDMSFHSDIVRLNVVAWGPPDAVNLANHEQLAVWLPQGLDINGRRHLENVRPFRWALLNGYYFSLGKTTHKSYRFAVGDENIIYRENGRIALVLDAYLRVSQRDELNVGCSGIIGREKIGKGSSQTGAALVYELPVSTMYTGISLQNASRRAYALRIQKVVECYDQLISSIAAGILAWHGAHAMVKIGYGAYWPIEIKEYILELLSIFKLLGQKMDQLCDATLEDGSKIVDSYIQPSGPTLTTLRSKAKGFSEKADKAIDSVSQVIPFTDAGGGSYFDNESAMKIWDGGKDFVRMLAPFAFLDPSGTICPGAGEDDRVGGYIKGLPDL